MGRRTLSERFWSKVRKTDGCWEWVGAKFVRGYGKILVQGKFLKTHRVSRELTNGPIPDDQCVCHKCDNKPCVRPDHLFLGTHVDNMADMKAKGRRKGIVNGSSNGRAKLTAENVVEILVSDVGHSELGRKYGVSHTTVRNIRLGKIWKELVAHCHKQMTID